MCYMALYQKKCAESWSQSPILIPFPTFPAGFKDRQVSQFGHEGYKKKATGHWGASGKNFSPCKNRYMRGDPLCLSLILPRGLSGENGRMTAILQP